MNDGIYKFFDGTHIDLSKIVSVTAPFASDNDGWYVSAGFSVHFQLRDKSVHYHWRGDVKENAARPNANCTWDDMPYIDSGESSFVTWSHIMLERVDRIHADLLKAWHDHRAWVIRNSVMRPE